MSSTQVQQLFEQGRAVMALPINSHQELGEARQQKLTWGLDLRADAEIAQGFIDAGGFPLTLERPSLDRKVRHFRETVFAQVRYLEAFLKNGKPL